MREMHDRSTLRVLVFPADDAALRHEVERVLEDLDEIMPEPEQIAELARRLRPWYRSLTVRARDAMGGYDDDPTRVWYVYRDGRIRARHAPLERLYLALADARTTVRASESALDHARDTTRNAGFGGQATVSDGFEPVVTVPRNAAD